jgi:hypothetical protein
MILLVIAGDAFRKWLHRAILALAQPTPRSNRDLPPEYYKFPLF